MRRKGIAGLSLVMGVIALGAFAPSAVAHPCATNIATMSLTSAIGWTGLPTAEDMECQYVELGAAQAEDTTTAAADPVDDAVASYTYSPNMTPVSYSARNVLPFTLNASFNSDLAFKGKFAYQGTYDGFRVIDYSDPANPTQIVNYTACSSTGGQGDVVVWGNILIRSWDSPANASATCAGQLVGQGFEGIHIFDITDPANPVMVRQLRMANTGNEAGAPPGCGSHTATAVPDTARGNLYLYNGGSSGNCTGMDIVRINIANPTDAAFLRRAAASRQCHDNNVIMGNVNLAMCAGGNGFSVFKFDPSIPADDPGGIANPTLLYSKPMGITTGHSGSFTYDGKVLIFGHEPGGGSQAQCQASSTLANRTLFFMEPLTGNQIGSLVHQRNQTNTENCTWHNFNVVPTYKGYAAIVGSYQKGISALDFTNPAAPQEIAFADPAPLVHPTNPNSIVLGGDWSTYWYNGTIYESDIRRGLTTWKLDSELFNRSRNVDISNPQTQMMSFDPDNEGATIDITTPTANADYAVGSVDHAGVHLHRQRRRRVVHRLGRDARHSHDRRAYLHGDREGSRRQRDDEDRHVQRAARRRGRQRVRVRPRHALADGRRAGLVRRLHPGRRAYLRGEHDGQRGLDRGRRDAERRRPGDDQRRPLGQRRVRAAAGTAGAGPERREHGHGVRGHQSELRSACSATAARSPTIRCRCSSARRSAPPTHCGRAPTTRRSSSRCRRRRRRRI